MSIKLKILLLYAIVFSLKSIQLKAKQKIKVSKNHVYINNIQIHCLQNLFKIVWISLIWISLTLSTNRSLVFVTTSEVLRKAIVFIDR